jgi:hypothetical protein
VHLPSHLEDARIDLDRVHALGALVEKHGDVVARARPNTSTWPGGLPRS